MKNLEKKSILGGEITEVKDLETGEVRILADDPAYTALKKIKLPNEEIEVVNPATGAKSMVTIDRRGTTDERLAVVLADKNSSRELKDSTVSAYLFERGKESASFIMDLIQREGRQSKSINKFKSQMREDYERLVDHLAAYNSDTSRMVYGVMNLTPKHFLDFYNLVEQHIIDERKEKKEVTIPKAVDFIARKHNDGIDETKVALLVLIVRQEDERRSLVEVEKSKIMERMRELGYGTYLTKEGKAYSIFDDEGKKKIKEDLNDNQEGNIADNGTDGDRIKPDNFSA